MNNEEKILQILMEMQAEQRKTNERLDKLEQGQTSLLADASGLKQGQASLLADVSTLKEDVAIIKEDAQITRGAVNTLLGWAEEAQVEVNIPLYKKAE